jgi:hypothetical protein
VDVRIEHGDYGRTNMGVVLRSVGYRLDQLHLKHVEKVNMADITTLCSCLRVLVFDHCTYVPREPYTVIRSDLPHFTSVRVLVIYETAEYVEYSRHLGYYANLVLFMCNGVDVMADDFMFEAVQNGAFRSIEHFEVIGSETGDLSMDTVWLLINNCEHLKTVGRLGTWRRVSPDDVSDLKTKIRSENLDLKIIK